jgi:threonine synthase
MQLYNTADPAQRVVIREAVLQSLASGKGLYMPCIIPMLPRSFFQNLEKLSFQESSFEVVKALFDGYMPDADLRQIIDTALNFSIELSALKSDIYSMELWHGPSLAFKDFGARFMAALMAYFAKGNDRPLTILVATSGDTGGAVAFGFLGVPNIEVIILYPKGKVSMLQEKQLTTLGNNIKACEIDGTFDDCQALVKEAFMNADLKEKYNLSSANSINIARLIPQTFYYFEAYKQLKNLQKKMIFSVPSGNFGNLTAGLIAQKMGLPVHHFIAATNDNKIVPDYLSLGIYNPKPSVATISNAMDVGNPSNFVRMQELFQHDLTEMRKYISGAHFTDEETKDEMRYIYHSSGYVSEPHGAIGHRALRNYMADKDDCVGVFLETAHPSKFEDVVNEVLGIEVEIPHRLAVLAQREKSAIALSKDFDGFKEYLLTR